MKRNGIWPAVNKHYKIFAIFAIVIAIIFSIELYNENSNAQEIKELSIKLK